MASATQSQKRNKSGRFIRERQKIMRWKVASCKSTMFWRPKGAGQYDVWMQWTWSVVGRWTKDRGDRDVSKGFSILLFLSTTHTTEKCGSRKMIWGWQVYSTSILLSPLLRLCFSILLKHFIPVRNKSCHVKTPPDSSSAPSRRATAWL